MSEGTLGRIYGGDPRLIHVPDGERAALGETLARELDHYMRSVAENRSPEELVNQPLCPGCYMVVGFDILIALADQNGQTRTELARCMMNAFRKLFDNPGSGMIEEIHVLLDPC